MASVIFRVPCKTSVARYTQTRLMASHQVAAVGAHGHEVDHHDDHHHQPAYRELIGKREIVGYGWAGEPAYADSIIWPYPSIRFREPSTTFQALQKKEQGDWKSLSVEDKKNLYRYNYCETFSEMHAPTGNWKSCIGIFCFWFSLAIWMFVGLKAIYPPLPDSVTNDEKRLAMLKKMIDLRVGAVDGLSSKWDYEKGRWKKD